MILKEHQNILVKKCIEFENNKQYINNIEFNSDIGFLIDDPGTGKSFVILELTNNKLNDKNWKKNLPVRFI